MSLQLSPDDTIGEDHDEDEVEVRFQAELQLALDISCAEQEPFTAEQEQDMWWCFLDISSSWLDY